MFTLRDVNKAIRSKGVTLRRGRGYFYLTSDNLQNPLYFASTSSIGVNNLSDLSLERWIKEVDWILEDGRKNM